MDTLIYVGATLVNRVHRRVRLSFYHGKQVLLLIVFCHVFVNLLNVYLNSKTCAVTAYVCFD